ncbi:MAG: BtrH N-terminal domain-containing protein [Bacteroidales bacterium]|nr:MAG: BtrH N-terminal domain-containing protein [Bacteroidales bacterium]
MRPERDTIIQFTHRPSAHCENGVTSNLLNFYLIDLSEPLVFGIGSGIFFSYMPFIKLNYLPVISFRPLPGWIFKRVNNRLGMKIKRKKFASPKKAMDALDANLERGIPTGCLVGVYHLTYFPRSYRFHFNAHNIIVFGRENDKYLVSDPVMEKPERLSYEDLKRVRYAKGTYPPIGRMYWVESKPEHFDLKKAIVKGIRKTSQDMLHIPVPLFGIKGIRYLSRRMRKWPHKFGPEKASLYLGQAIRMLEEIGTGGAGFRFIYAAFLQEAAGILEMDWLNELSDEMTAAGDRWRQFAIMAGRIFKNRANNEETYETAANILMDIAEREERIFRRLKKISLSE